MECDRANAKEFGRNLCCSLIIAAAQRQKLVWRLSTIRFPSHISGWWASLPVEKVPAEAEKMHKIQQVPFERDEWYVAAEKKFLLQHGLEIYRAPFDGNRSTIRKIISQAKVDVVKSLTECGKSKHGYYISVQDNLPGETAGSKW